MRSSRSVAPAVWDQVPNSLSGGLLRVSITDEADLGLDSWPPGVLEEISPNDEMFSSESGSTSYFFWGRAALRSITHALAALEHRDIGSVLDLPCGHGRVLRMLRAAFPVAAITACDINRDGVDFCCETFGADPVYAGAAPAQTDLPRKFDLVWCGSLLTHLDEPACLELLNLFSRSLERGGALVLTAHGPHYRTLIELDQIRLGVPDRLALIDRYDHDGFAYQDYPGREGYGISLISSGKMIEMLESVPGLRCDYYAARGWAGFHDVWACVRI